MELKAIEETVSKSAPLLGSVIKESNPIAGMVIMMLAKLFDSSSDPSELLNKMALDPNSESKLRQLEIDHQDALIQNQVEDRINARDRETKIIQLTGKRDWLLDTVTLIVVLGFFILCIINYFIKLNDDDIVIMLIGQISSGFMLILSYYFGSSNKK